LHELLGYPSERIAELRRAGAFGSDGMETVEGVLP